MPPARFHVSHDGASLLQSQQVLGNAGFACAYGSDNIPAGRRAVRGKVAQDLVARPVAKSRDSSLDVGGPGVILRLSNPWHGSILTEHVPKSKTRSLDDTLIIVDNSLHSFTLFLAVSIPAATPAEPLVPAPNPLESVSRSGEDYESRSQVE